MTTRLSLTIGAVVALLFLFAAAPEAKAQGCDVPPTACLTCVMNPKSPRFCPKVPCKATVPGGSAWGMCTSPCKCGASASTGQKGEQQGMGDAKGMMDALKSVMDMLKGKGGGGGGGGGQPPPQPEQGCTSYYQVTAPTTDPCAYYVPPTSDSLLQTSGLPASGSDALLDALNAGDSSALNVSDTLLGALGGGVTTQTQQTTDAEGGGAASSQSASQATPQAGSGLSGQQVNLQSGTRGDIVVTDGGATFVGQARDIGANTEVAGFYGSNSSGGQPQGVIAGMCEGRPWASSVVSFVIPPAFFDGLCAWRGYQIGSPAPPSQPVVEGGAMRQSSTPTPAPAPSPQPQVSTIPPHVEIWAVPDRVPLGTRTSVFWNTRGVASCSITSPEGSFNETSLTGGAATVPLTGATTFTISCLTPSGEPVTDFVTVELSI